MEALNHRFMLYIIDSSYNIILVIIYMLQKTYKYQETQRLMGKNLNFGVLPIDLGKLIWFSHE